MDDDDANQEGDFGEYSSARKLVQRAADREALLKSFKAGGGGGPSEVASDNKLASSDRVKSSSSSGDAAPPPASSSSPSSLGSDFSSMSLKRDHPSRPCWTCPDGTIYLEAFHPLYATAYDFLVAIAEPVTRPEYVHEYKLTPYSLYAAVATNIDTESIVRVLQRYSKNALPESVARFVRDCTKRYGKAKLVLKHNRYHVESDHPSVLRELLRDDLISQARVAEADGAVGGGGDGGGTGGDAGGGRVGDGGQHPRRGGGGGKDTEGFAVNAKAEEMEENLRILKEMDGDDDDDDDGDGDDDGDDDDGEGGEGGEGGGGGRSSSAKGGRRRRNEPKTTVSFQIKAEDVEIVKRRAIE